MCGDKVIESRISVVIPTHRRAQLLKLAIESVLNQTYPPVEILVVDDSDCNQTQDLVRQYDSSMIRYVANYNAHGASSSRNIGIKEANGDYVAFLDDDDIWYPSKLEKQVGLITKSNLDAVFSRLEIKYEGTNLSYSTNSSMPNNPLQKICIENFIGATISAVVKRDMLLSVNGFDESFPAREEYDLWIRLIAAGARIGIVEEPLAVSYRSLQNRKRISASIANYECAIDMLNQKHSDLIQDILSHKQLKVRRSRQFEFLSAQAVSIGLRWKAVYYYLRSFANSYSMKALLLGVLACVSPILLIKIRARLGGVK